MSLADVPKLLACHIRFIERDHVVLLLILARHHQEGASHRKTDFGADHFALQRHACCKHAVQQRMQTKLSQMVRLLRTFSRSLDNIISGNSSDTKEVAYRSRKPACIHLIQRCPRHPTGDKGKALAEILTSCYADSGKSLRHPGQYVASAAADFQKIAHLREKPLQSIDDQPVAPAKPKITGLDLRQFGKELGAETITSFGGGKQRKAAGPTGHTAA